MGHDKRQKKVSIAKHSKISVTLTFRRSERLELQIQNSMRYIREYLRAYKDLTLVPELGAGRLHYHFCASIKDVLKHKCFMHNWNAKYGTAHVDSWDGTPKFKKYLEKEDILHSLLPNELPKGYVINSAENITSFLKLFRARYFKQVKESGDENDLLKIYQLKPITSFFLPPEADAFGETPSEQKAQLEYDAEELERRYDENMQLMLEMSSDSDEGC